MKFSWPRCERRSNVSVRSHCVEHMLEHIQLVRLQARWEHWQTVLRNVGNFILAAEREQNNINFFSIPHPARAFVVVLSSHVHNPGYAVSTLPLHGGLEQPGVIGIFDALKSCDMLKGKSVLARSLWSNMAISISKASAGSMGVGFIVWYCAKSIIAVSNSLDASICSYDRAESASGLSRSQDLPTQGCSVGQSLGAITKLAADICAVCSI